VAKLQIQPTKAEDETREFSFPGLMKTLYFHRVAFFWVFGLLTAAGIILSLMPRFYDAEAALWVEPGESSSLALSSLASSITGQESDIVASEVLALQSRTLSLRVAKELNLSCQKEFWGPLWLIEMPDKNNCNLTDPYWRDVVYKKMTKVLDVQNDGKDEVIYVDAKSISPVLATKIVNTLVNDYLAYLLEMRYGANQRASVWLISQLGDLKNRVDKDQEELIRLQEKLGVLGFSASGTDYIYGQQLSELMKASDDAKVGRIVAEAKLRFLKESDPNLMEGEISVLPNPMEPGPTESLLATLRASQAQASSNYARLLSQYGANYPDAKQQKAQLDQVSKEVTDEQNRILNQAKLAYDAASANENMTTGNLDREKSKIFGSRDDMARFSTLSQDYAADRSLYKGLLVQLQTAGISSGLQAGDIDVVDLADLPGKPTILGPLIYLPGGVILGIIFGSFFSLWLASMDQNIRGPEHMEKLTGLSLLAQLPHVKQEKVTAGDGSKNLPLVIASLRSHYSEAVQSLRASLLLSRPGSAPKVILVTSAVPGEGKSTTAINLAATFARFGARVLVGDCDLRRGMVAKRLHISAAEGMTSVLTRQMPVEAAIQECPGVPGLYVLPDGPRSPDPAVLVGSDEMRRLIDTCRENFDFVILDAPPVLGIADGLELGQMCDGVLLVARERVSNSKAVKETAAMMAAANLTVVGFAYNDVDPRASGYGYGYAYRNYYHSYYIDQAPVAEREEV
jgi:capsular exopolysaccharide synthesis family protein